MTDVIISEEEWQKVQELVERIKRRGWEQEDDVKNLNNLLNALHGEGIRAREYTKSGEPEVFKNGKWSQR